MDVSALFLSSGASLCLGKGSSEGEGKAGSKASTEERWHTVVRHIGSVLSSYISSLVIATEGDDLEV
jgi:hypothetical protein